MAIEIVGMDVVLEVEKWMSSICIAKLDDENKELAIASNSPVVTDLISRGLSMGENLGVINGTPVVMGSAANTLYNSEPDKYQFISIDPDCIEAERKLGFPVFGPIREKVLYRQRTMTADVFDRYVSLLYSGLSVKFSLPRSFLISSLAEFYPDTSAARIVQRVMSTSLSFDLDCESDIKIFSFIRYDLVSIQDVEVSTLTPEVIDNFFFRLWGDN